MRKGTLSKVVSLRLWPQILPKEFITREIFEYLQVLPCYQDKLYIKQVLLLKIYKLSTGCEEMSLYLKQALKTNINSAKR